MAAWVMVWPSPYPECWILRWGKCVTVQWQISVHAQCAWAIFPQKNNADGGDSFKNSKYNFTLPGKGYMTTTKVLADKDVSSILFHYVSFLELRIHQCSWHRVEHFGIQVQCMQMDSKLLWSRNGMSHCGEGGWRRGCFVTWPNKGCDEDQHKLWTNRMTEWFLSLPPLVKRA